MSKKKLIAVAITLALLLLIGGLLAYFTDTDTEINNFTLGNDVNIEINEVWNELDGLNVLPGANVTKQPSIENKDDSSKAFVFAEITVPCYKSNPTSGDFDTPMFTFTPNSGWTRIDSNTVDTTNGTITYVYAYGSASAMTELNPGAQTSTAVFDHVLLDPNMTQEQGGTASVTDITVDAVAIQSANLGTVEPSAVYALAKPNP